MDPFIQDARARARSTQVAKMKRTPVVVIGIDTADIDRVDRLVDEGRMPRLAALRSAGLCGRVEPWPPGFFDMVWPSFNTGRPLAEHGWYYGKLWLPERMHLEFTRPDWLPQDPFWARLPATEYRVGLVDVPFAPLPGRELQGVYINGWQCHDGTIDHVAPHGLRRELTSRFGRPIQPRVDPFGPQSAARFRSIRDAAIAATAQIAAICRWLLAREPFDLFVVVLGGAHRAGHYAFDLSQIDASALDPSARAGLSAALDDVYAACDAAVGEIAQAAPAGARVMACALHGMGRESGWSEQFPRLLASIAGDGEPATAARGLLYRLKSRVPPGLVRRAREMVPDAWCNAVIPLWSRRMHDWSRTRFFALPSDLGGFLRINLRGRERLGVVEPGAEYDALCDMLTEAFLSLRDIESGAAVVDSVDRVDRLVGPKAPARPWLPDLVVNWGPLAARDLVGVRSAGHGEVRWQRDWRMSSGRSGNHRPTGWFVATGPGIAAGVSNKARRAEDLAHMISAWLGAHPDEGVPDEAVRSGHARPA
jgi:predicted AlkP superfamily phosphohydrolase/phosphomutase